MISNTQIRNALTGALAIMALGLFTSCSESLVAPAGDTLEPMAPPARAEQAPLQSCSLVDGVWVCTSTGTVTLGDDGDEEYCEFIMGVLYCQPKEG